MRVENTKIKLTIPIPIDKPDLNGVVYTEEAIENALKHLKTNIPILYKENEESEAKVIGTTTGTYRVTTWDYEKQVCKVALDGVIFHSGAEIVVNELEDGKVTDFRIENIGLTI